jgi:hypothetical protein
MGLRKNLGRKEKASLGDADLGIRGVQGMELRGKGHLWGTALIKKCSAPT